MIGGMGGAADGLRRVRVGPEVPDELRRLWRLSAPSRLGRPAELDLERVVGAAVDLADRGGLAGASLPKVARALGYTAMSLYRYVGSKDELLCLMRDFAIGNPPKIATRPREWRSGLRRWACAERLLNERRPWLARLPIGGPPTGPHQIAWIETALRVLRGSGLDWAQKLGLISLISGYVRYASLLSHDLARGRDGTGIDEPQAAQRYGRSMATLVDPSRFPEAARLFASDVFQASRRRAGVDPTADPDFSFGLERILDGAAAAIARARVR